VIKLPFDFSTEQDPRWSDNPIFLPGVEVQQFAGHHGKEENACSLHECRLTIILALLSVAVLKLLEHPEKPYFGVMVGSICIGEGFG
jgi:hypothetical protein